MNKVHHNEKQEKQQETKSNKEANIKGLGVGTKEAREELAEEKSLRKQIKSKINNIDIGSESIGKSVVGSSVVDVSSLSSFSTPSVQRIANKKKNSLDADMIDEETIQEMHQKHDASKNDNELTKQTWQRGEKETTSTGTNKVQQKILIERHTEKKHATKQDEETHHGLTTTQPNTQPNAQPAPEDNVDNFITSSQNGEKSRGVTKLLEPSNERSSKSLISSSKSQSLSDDTTRNPVEGFIDKGLHEKGLNEEGTQAFVDRTKLEKPLRGDESSSSSQFGN
jgi:hypothetical protein